MDEIGCIRSRIDVFQSSISSLTGIYLAIFSTLLTVSTLIIDNSRGASEEAKNAMLNAQEIRDTLKQNLQAQSDITLPLDGTYKSIQQQDSILLETPIESSD